MILIINTANKDYAEIILVDSETKFQVVRIDGKYNQSESLLPAIEQVIANNNKSINDLSGLVVVSGPGGFTALRIGVVVANTLAHALSIPVIGINQNAFDGDNQKLVDISTSKLATAKIGSIVEPEYGREPNIT